MLSQIEPSEEVVDGPRPVHETRVIDLTTAGFISLPADLGAAPEPTDGRGGGAVVVVSLPGGDGGGLIDLVRLLADVSDDDGAADDGPRRTVLHAPWRGDADETITGIARNYQRVRAIVVAPLDLRFGAYLDTAPSGSPLAPRGSAARRDVDWAAVESRHDDAHTSRQRWYEAVDRHGIATIDVYTEHWRAKPVVVASGICRWLGLDPVAPEDESVAALLTGPADPHEADLRHRVKGRVPCADCDAAVAASRRLDRLTAYAFTVGSNEQRDPAGPQ